MPIICNHLTSNPVSLEIIRPTAYTNTGSGGGLTNPTNAYDGSTSTYALLHQQGTLSVDRTRTTTWVTFGSKAQTWTSWSMKMLYSNTANPAYDIVTPFVEIDTMTDGSTYSMYGISYVGETLQTLTIASGSGNPTSSVFGVKLIASGPNGGGITPDGEDFAIYDIWVEGSY